MNTAHDSRMAARRWRWRPELGRWFFGVRDEVLLDGEWQIATRYFTIAIMSWRIGRTHMYYDGPHDVLHIGWLAFGWSLNWCCRCMPCGSADCSVCKGRQP